MTDDKDATHRAIIHAHSRKRRRGGSGTKRHAGSSQWSGSGDDDSESVVVFAAAVCTSAVAALRHRYPAHRPPRHAHTRAHRQRDDDANERHRANERKRTNDSKTRPRLDQKCCVRPRYSFAPFFQLFHILLFFSFPRPPLTYAIRTFHYKLPELRVCVCVRALRELVSASRRRRCAGASRFLARETKFSSSSFLLTFFFGAFAFFSSFLSTSHPTPPRPVHEAFVSRGFRTKRKFFSPTCSIRTCQFNSKRCTLTETAGYEDEKKMCIVIEGSDANFQRGTHFYYDYGSEF